MSHLPPRRVCRLSSNGRWASIPRSLADLGIALAVVLCTAATAAGDGPGLRIATAAVHLEGSGLGTFAGDFPFDEPIPLREVSAVHLDALLVQVFHFDSPAFEIDIRLELLAGDTVVHTLVAGSLFWGNGTQSATFRAAFPVSPRFGIADRLRIQITNRLHDGGGGELNATTVVTGLEPDESLHLRFIERAVEPAGPHVVREVRGVRELTLMGAGVTTWDEFIFDRPVPTKDLRFVYHDPFVWSRDDLDGGQMSESHLILEGARDDDSYVALDDAFSPSLGVPGEPGNIASGHSLEIDGATRRDLGGRSIVGWRWRIHRSAGTGRTTFTPPDPVRFHFVYEFTDCNQNNVPDGDELATGTASDCDLNRIPDACDPDCNANGLPDVCDLREQRSADCNGNGLPDECDVVPPLAVDLEPVGPVAVGGSPSTLVWAEAIGDTAGYLAVADRVGGVLADRGGTLAIYLQGDDGALERSTHPSLDINAPRFLLAGDLDQDGDADLISVSAEEIVVIEQNGPQSFQALPPLAVEGSPSDGELGDVDGDGRLDFVLAKRNADAVAVFINRSGSGVAGEAAFFTDETVYPGANAPFGVRLADLDHDGDLDWVALSADSLGAGVVIALNQGAGRFDAAVLLALDHLPTTATGVVAADLDGDGTIELVTYDAARRQIVTRSVVMRLTGHFAIAEGERRVAVVATPIDMTAADLNGDGQLDIATADRGGDGSLSIYLGRGDGSFAPAIGVLAGGGLTAVVRADLDGDRAADLLAIDATAAAPRIVRYDAHPVAALSPDCNRNSVPDDCDIAAGALADADGDGLADQCGITFRRGDANGDGSLDIADAVFTLGHLFTGGEAPSCLDAADSDDSEQLEITDAVLSLNFLFAGRNAPPAPHPDCGEDPTEGATVKLGCDEYESCGQ